MQAKLFFFAMQAISPFKVSPAAWLAAAHTAPTRQGASAAPAESHAAPGKFSAGEGILKEALDVASAAERALEPFVVAAAEALRADGKDAAALAVRSTIGAWCRR